MNKYAFAAFFLAFSSSAISAEPDFYLMPTECKMMFGSLSHGQINTANADLPLWGCARAGKNLKCSGIFKEAKSIDKPTSMKIVIDSPPLLMASTDNGAEFLSINSKERIAIASYRMTDPIYLGAKICSYKYLTSYEMELLDKAK